MSSTKKPYNNIYPFYESALQARIEKAERNKEQKNINIRNQNERRKECLKRVVVTEASELTNVLAKSKFRRILDFILRRKISYK